MTREDFLHKVALRAANVAIARCAEEDFFPTNWRRAEDLASDIYGWLDTFMQKDGIPPKRPGAP